MRLRVGTLLLTFLASTAFAQEAPPANPLSLNNKGLYSGLKMMLRRSAEKMAEEHYDFRPAAEVRSYGQIVGHIADAQYIFCAAVLGEKNPGLKIEKTKTSKAELVAALDAALTYCDRAYDGLTDATATQTVKIMGGDRPKLSVLTINNLHSVEHYGNLVTYMRMKNVVPPTSEPGFMEKASGK